MPVYVQSVLLFDAAISLLVGAPVFSETHCFCQAIWVHFLTARLAAAAS